MASRASLLKSRWLNVGVKLLIYAGMLLLKASTRSISRSILSPSEPPVVVSPPRYEGLIIYVGSILIMGCACHPAFTSLDNPCISRIIDARRAGIASLKPLPIPKGRKWPTSLAMTRDGEAIPNSFLAKLTRL